MGTLNFLWDTAKNSFTAGSITFSTYICSEKLFLLIFGFQTYAICLQIRIPDGYCCVDGDNSASTLDSRSFGPVTYSTIKKKNISLTCLLQGRATHIVWPPERVGKVEEKMPEGRLGPY
ncbi:hypothetical protein MKX01_024252 [Papaver californicum]|nr:hypothetical protein MKX01_024252 [Papaver californicum]